MEAQAAAAVAPEQLAPEEAAWQQGVAVETLVAPAVLPTRSEEVVAAEAATEAAGTAPEAAAAEAVERSSEAATAAKSAERATAVS